MSQIPIFFDEYFLLKNLLIRVDFTEAFRHNTQATEKGMTMQFTHKETDATFVYENVTSENEIAWWADFPHKIFMSDGSVRYATVLKTVAHVCVDEDDYGNPVIEKWQIKRHMQW